MVIGRNSRVQRDRTDVDEEASQLVLDAFREESRDGLSSPFDAALDCYTKKYPHVSRELASHAVAHILAKAGF
jgi:hypothetical protein